MEIEQVGGASDGAAPRLVIKDMELENFKSYAGKQRVGPFHKVTTTLRVSARRGLASPLQALEGWRDRSEGTPGVPGLLGRETFSFELELTV